MNDPPFEQPPPGHYQTVEARLRDENRQLRETVGALRREINQLQDTIARLEHEHTHQPTRKKRKR